MWISPRWVSNRRSPLSRVVVAYPTSLGRRRLRLDSKAAPSQLQAFCARVDLCMMLVSERYHLVLDVCRRLEIALEKKTVELANVFHILRGHFVEWEVPATRVIGPLHHIV
jgi:hypothetical protein